MSRALLNMKRFIKPCLRRCGMQMPRQGKTILILGAAENCEPDLLLPDDLNNLRRVIVQQRNPRALQNKRIAARLGNQHRPQQHVTARRKAAARHTLEIFAFIFLFSLPSLISRRYLG